MILLCNTNSFVTMIIPDNKHLGRLCKRKHEWNETGKSLRFSKGSACVECSRIDLREHRQAKPQSSKISDARLGKLCKYGHEWNGTGQSLRIRSHGGCVECRKIKDKNAYYKDHAATLEKRKLYPSSSPERCRVYAEKGKQKKAISSKKWAEANKDRKRLTAKIWRQTEKGKLTRFKIKSKRRAAKINSSHSPYSIEDVQERFSIIGSGCLYCGSCEKMSIDHFVSLNKGGLDALTNLVPACQSCNASKRDCDPIDWVLSRVTDPELLKKFTWITGIDWIVFDPRWINATKQI